MEASFPKKCFISYSYKDEDVSELLKKKLRNRGVESFTFPPIRLPPDKLISNKLIEAILSYQALVFIKGGHSNLSFWVAFERDYAIRANKQVYSFDPETLKIEKYRLKPLQLPIFPSYLSKDARKLQGLFTFMQQRYFDLHTWQKSHGSRIDVVPESINSPVSKGGYSVIFLTSKSLKSKIMKSEMEYALNTHPDRILVGLVDDIHKKDIPGFSEKVRYIQLFGDSKRSEKQRWDDLIVNLYWLIFNPSYEL